MTQSTDSKVTDPFEFLQQAFTQWPPVGEDSKENLRAFWKRQNSMLDSMAEFSRGWFDRRHEATMAALNAATSMCDAQNPMESIQHCQTWAMGSAERIAADIAAWQKHMMNAAELLATPLSAETKERKVEINAVSPARAA